MGGGKEESNFLGGMEVLGELFTGLLLGGSTACRGQVASSKISGKKPTGHKYHWTGKVAPPTLF